MIYEPGQNTDARHDHEKSFPLSKICSGLPPGAGDADDHGAEGPCERHDFVAAHDDGLRVVEPAVTLRFY